MEHFEGVLEVHASAGDNFLGGDDFLEILVRHYLKKASLEKDKVNGKHMARLYAEMEKVKKRLNSFEHVVIEPLPDISENEITITAEEFRSEERRVGKECRSRWWQDA
mgnify:CR=1 FL=1